MEKLNPSKIIDYTLSIDNLLYLKYNSARQLNIMLEREPEMMNVDLNRMQQVVQEAFNKVSDSRRWQTAIIKAKQQIEENPYLHFDGQALLILSPSGEIYTANGSCQCRAYTNGQPCWHRAAARLIERYIQTSH
jgi:hypothetical protein